MSLFTANTFSDKTINGNLSKNFDSNYKGLANILTPESSGYIDIINNFPWTLTPQSSLALKETPYIELTEFYLLESVINQLFLSYGIKVDNRIDLLNAFATTFGVPNKNASLLYEGLYDHTNPTGFVYKFPYFTNMRNSISNSWKEKNMYNEILQKQIYFSGLEGGGIGGTIKRLTSKFGSKIPLLGTVIPTGDTIKKYSEMMTRTQAQLAQTSIGLNSPVARPEGQDPALDVPKIWSTTTPQTFSFSFPLYNTLSEQQIVSNWEFCHLLTYQNLFNKRNLFTGVPPVFYQIKIPGIYFSKAGYISNLNIKNVGNIHRMSIKTGNRNIEVNIPDAYLIDIAVTDFFMPSKNFLDSVTDSTGSKVTSLNASSSWSTKPEAPLSTLNTTSTPNLGGRPTAPITGPDPFSRR
jgi:hypothetical protein